MDLSQFEAKPHPVKARLCAHGVKCATVANFIGRAYSTANNYLNGIVPVPPATEARLTALADELDAANPQPGAAR